MELINQNKKEVTEAFLVQYKLYIEMMDKVSERRGNANSFFITLHTVTLGVVGINGFSIEKYSWIIVVWGLILSYVWWYTLHSYKLLNTGKFEVIHEMEKELPMNVYAYEWEILDYGKNRAKYWPISHLEHFIPIVFALVYISFGLCVWIGGIPK